MLKVGPLLGSLTRFCPLSQEAESKGVRGRKLLKSKGCPPVKIQYTKCRGGRWLCIMRFCHIGEFSEKRFIRIVSHVMFAKSDPPSLFSHLEATMIVRDRSYPSSKTNKAIGNPGTHRFRCSVIDHLFLVSTQNSPGQLGEDETRRR